MWNRCGFGYVPGEISPRGTQTFPHPRKLCQGLGYWGYLCLWEEVGSANQAEAEL